MGAFPPYDFRDPGMLRAALRHSSLAGREKFTPAVSPSPSPSSSSASSSPGAGASSSASASVPGRNENFERLEFLGDRVVGLVVAALLLERFPGKPEGVLSRHHTSLVRAETLARIARDVGLHTRLETATNEGAFGGGVNETMLSDALEAVMGAVYLDGGLGAAEKIIRALWEPLLLEQPADLRDPKTRLQEWAQGRSLPLPHYEVVDQTGPAHAPHFRVRVSIAGAGDAAGEGSSKRTAEQQAALTLLQKVELPPT